MHDTLNNLLVDMTIMATLGLFTVALGIMLSVASDALLVVMRKRKSLF